MKEKNEKNLLPRLLEITIGAVRHVLEKTMVKGFIPVGFSIVFYNPNTYEKRWYYDMRVVVDSHDPNLLNRQAGDRIELVNQFLSEGVKRILDGKHDDMIVDPSKIDGQSFQVPGLTGRG